MDTRRALIRNEFAENLTNNAMSFLTDAYLLDKYGPRLSLDHISELLGASKSSLYSQISAGTLALPTYVDGGKRWADYRDVSAYLDSCRQRAA